MNCTCFSSLIGGVDDAFAFINFVLTNPDQAFEDINAIAHTIGFDLNDIPGSMLNLTTATLGDLANRFESVMPPLAQTLINVFLKPLINSAITLALAFTAATNLLLNQFLQELVTNLPNSNIINVLGGVIPSLFALFG